MEKKRLGWERDSRGEAAPFASLEDLSDESPPPGASKLEVPGTTTGPGGGPPRIDISRASSSSHHEDSSPERELFAGEGGVKVGLGFTEDMALELRSSTEELDFHEPEPERKSKKKKLQQQQAVIVTKYEQDGESEKENRERKDSGCSEGGLLFIGGRSSRLSSIGSAASGGSGVSAGSAVSHLSAASNYSRASRCSSPHRMLLETSFCGPKPIPTLSLEAEYPPSESVEAALLKRKADPAGAILPNCLEVAGGKPRRTSSERTVRPTPPVVPAVRSSSARAPRKPHVRKKEDENALVRIIPLHGSVDDDDYEDEPEEEASSATRDDDFQPENGIYIPLKGPIIDTRPPEPRPQPAAQRRPEPRTPRQEEPVRRQPQREQEPARRQPQKEQEPARKQQADQQQERRKKPDIEESDLVRFISLHGDDDEDIQRRNQSVQFKSATDVRERQYMDLSDWPKPRPRSPDPPKPGRLELEKKKNGRSLGQIPRDESRTPSPASSFSKGNIFRRSSDSSGSSKKSLSSSDSKTKKDSRNKSMFTSLFKKNVKETPVQKPQPEKPHIDPKLTNVEYKFRQDENVIDKDTIIIPLHSPDEIVEPLIRYDPAKEKEREREQNEPIRERVKPEMKSQQQGSESQRSSMEVQTIEKNIVVVDVINEDTKEHPVKAEPKTPVEQKKVAKESKRKVDELEVYDYEPRVRRSSSICSREAEAVSLASEERSIDREISKEEKESIKVRGEEKGKELKQVKSYEPKQEKSIESKQEKSKESKQEKSKEPKQEKGKEPKQEKSKEPEIVSAKQEERDEGRDRKSADKEETLLKSESGETCRQASQETVIENQAAREEKERDLLTAVLQDEEVESLIKEDSENNIATSQERRSSESEPELEPETDEERKGLFLQTDSVEDELPYVPTTLPQERSVAVPIVPIRQRTGEVKTCSVDRPRSTTPIQPSNLEEYAAFHEPRPVHQEKMQITLPRTDWPGSKGRGGKGCSPPPPLPPRAPQWVAFDEPERRRPPRRITTLPLTYVNPEECTCECHELRPQHCAKTPQHCPANNQQARTDREKRYRTQDR